MLKTTIAGSLPKPGWLAETNKLWPAWRAQGAELERAKRDATLLWLKEQEDAGLDIVTDGEQSRQHFVHGFLEFVEGIDFSRKVKMGIRNNRYDAMVPVVTGPLKLKGRVHQAEARILRQHSKKQIKITMPGTDDHRRYPRRRALRRQGEARDGVRRLLNQEARALERTAST
jgi:5-methyltetrahydropteroyltriglutamate--homocysteine methyltransferase